MNVRTNRVFWDRRVPSEPGKRLLRHATFENEAVDPFPGPDLRAIIRVTANDAVANEVL